MRPINRTVARIALSLACAINAGVFAAEQTTGHEPDAAVAAYREQIDQHRRHFGTQDYALTESYVALAFAERRNNDHAAAADSFARALFLERVHKGLEHPDQIPLIERLVESNRMHAAWPEVADNLRLLEWVNRRGREPGDPAYLETLHQLALWHFEASEKPTGIGSYEHFRRALDQIDHAISTLALRGGDQGRELAPWLRLKAAVSYGAVQELTLSFKPPVTTVRGQRVLTATDADFGDIAFHQNRIAQHHAAGREALQQTLDIARTNNDAQGMAMATLHLGDWYQLFGRYRKAEKFYADANRLAGSAGMSLSASHRRLPNFLADGLPGATVAEPDADVKYVRTRFDIDERGRAHNVEIMEIQPPGAHGLARKARKQLLETRFRPRFDSEGATATSGVEIRFLFPAVARGKGAIL